MSIPPISSNSCLQEVLEIENEQLQKSWIFVEEDALTTTKKIFSKKAEQLHLNLDPINRFLNELNPIIHYEGSIYKILYVVDDRLEYYFPRFPYGSYAYSDAVLSYIEKRLQKIYDFYGEQQKNSHWKILKIARKVEESLSKIISNYSTGYYPDFVVSLSEKKAQLEAFILEQVAELNDAVEKRMETLQNGTLFQLLNHYADSYPKDLIYALIEKNYGPRLKDIVIQLFPSEDNRIFHDMAYKFLFVIASCVNIDDLKWKYLKIIGDKFPSPPFENLSDQKIEDLLNMFRRAPDGSNLLDYFDIKISLDKFIVEDSFLSQNAALNLFEQNLLNEIQVYADIESSVIWQQSPTIQMSQIQMYDQLETLLKNPYKSQIFHTDRYISFLTTAATIIAYVNSIQSNSEEVNERLPKIIEILEDILNHAEEMYPQGYIEEYKVHWNALIGKLNETIQINNTDFSDYYLQLFAHPLIDDESKKETLEYFLKLQPIEYLARKVAYWNRYYLINSFHTNESGELKDLNTFSHRTGTLFYFTDKNKRTLFEIKKIIHRDGMVCQIAMPIRFNEESVPIKILFQGTIENALSIKRDGNLKGAGYDLWHHEKSNLVLPDLYKIIEEVYSETKKPVNLSFAGHSLGGSELQNAVSFLAENLLRKKFDDSLINKIYIHTFNSAGIPKESINRFNLNIKNFTSKIAKITHSVVKHDLVSKSNEGKLGAEFLNQKKVLVMEISNYGVFHLIINHCDYIHSWTNNILPHRLLTDSEKGRSRHRYLYGITYSWTDLKNHTFDIVHSSPITQIALGALIFGGASFFQYQLIRAARGIILIGGTLSQPGVVMARNAAEGFSKKQMTDAIDTIWEGFSRKWYGTQILEGTG